MRSAPLYAKESNNRMPAAAFSFNSDKGRCPDCAGYGRKLIDLKFLPDMWVTCDTCEGRRFTPEVLAVTYRGLAIDELLMLTTDEAVDFFAQGPAKLRSILTTVQQVGLGYLPLGQPATELSGGEAQRLRLANAIQRSTSGKGTGLLVLDEPTAGLHPANVEELLATFGAIVEAGNTVVIAEHDLHVAACADWVVDMGPGAGEDGGKVINLRGGLEGHGKCCPGRISIGKGAGMRVLFTTSAWSQHYYTMVPLAWAFRSAGHEVAVAAAPNMRGIVTRTGLPAVAAGPEMDLPGMNRQTLDRTRHGPPADVPLSGDEVLERWRQVALTGLEDVVGFARQWRPGLVVCDPLAPAGLVAAHVLGVPGFRHLLAVDILGSARGEALLAVLPGFYEPFERDGLQVTGDPAAATVDPYPPSLQPPPGPARKPVQYVPYNGTGELHPTALPPRTSRPRACLTFGNSTTLAGGTRAFPAAAALHALTEAGAEVIAALNPRDRHLLPGKLPADR
jgi:energy-coupling factor transporter ATP-binding protein EcfA2